MPIFPTVLRLRNTAAKNLSLSRSYVKAREAQPHIRKGEEKYVVEIGYQTFHNKSLLNAYTFRYHGLTNM